jgi:RNA polymerase sigma factor (sigma-70 family)
VLEHRNAMRRKVRQRQESGAIGEREELGDVAARPAPGEEFDDVHEALKRIGRDAARIIRMKHFEERTFEEIGLLLSVSPNTAKARYYRGLEELRPLLDSGGGGGGGGA